MTDLRRLLSIASIMLVVVTVGCAYEVEHPVYSPTGDAKTIKELTESVAPVMEMSDEQIVGFISDKTDFSIVGCENCRGGAEGGRSAVFEWTIDDPYHIKCTHCGHVYPSEKYPMDKTLKIVNPVGEEQEYHYHQAEDGRTYFWDCKIRGYIKGYFAARAGDLAILYHLTEEPQYAHKAALILHRFAQVFPGYPIRGHDAYSVSPSQDIQIKPSGDQPGSAFYDSKICAPDYEGAMPYWAGKWSRWFYGNIPIGLFKAHDLICNSSAYEELGEGARERVENDLLRLSVQNILKWPKRWGNMDGNRIMGFIVAGRVLGEPDWIHYALTWFTEILEKSYFYDGMWHEGTACYHRQITNRLARVPDLADGHSDPPGYTYEETGARYDNLRVQRDIPALSRAITSVVKLALPAEKNGRSFYAVTHDCDWNKVCWPLARRQSECLILPGMGHAILGMGENDNQVQAHLHYGGASGHDHRDTLNVIFYAKGKELLSEFGYCRTTLRGWSSGTPGHNTVVIDETNQGGGVLGRLGIFDTTGPDAYAVEADGTTRYEAKADLYKRAIVLVRVGEADSYLFDVFRVQGGSVHDWMQHSNANEEQAFSSDLKLTPREGTLYTHIKELREAAADSPWTMTNTCADGTALKTHVLAPEETQVIVGRCPRIRGAQRDESRIHDLWMPIVAVRTGEPLPAGTEVTEPLRTTFVAVQEPYREATFIDSVRNLDVQGGADAVAVAVKIGDATDYLISTNEQAPYEQETQVPELKLTFRGRLAYVHTEEGKVKSVHIFDGVDLSMGDLQVKTGGPLSGTITGVRRQEAGDDSNAFVTDVQLPADAVLAGRILIITHGDTTAHGYTIQRIERVGETTLIHVFDEPGLEIAEDETKMIYFPHRVIKGDNTFYIAGSKAVQYQ